MAEVAEGKWGTVYKQIAVEVRNLWNKSSMYPGKYIRLYSDKMDRWCAASSKERYSSSTGFYFSMCGNGYNSACRIGNGK